MNPTAIEQEQRYEFTFQGMQLYTQVCTTNGVKDIYHTDPETNNPVVIGYLTRGFTQEIWYLTFYQDKIGHFQTYIYNCYNEEWLLIQFGVENDYLSQEDSIVLLNLQEHLENRQGLKHSIG